LPLHPRTRDAVARHGLNLGSIRIVDPVSYLDMIALLNGCSGVLTDSGGLQKEAYFFRKPCVTLRNVTEWRKPWKLAGIDSGKMTNIRPGKTSAPMAMVTRRRK
jgi:UDP-N-acetylglucosamine 2-epimerase